MTILFTEGFGIYSKVPVVGGLDSLLFQKWDSSVGTFAGNHQLVSGRHSGVNLALDMGGGTGIRKNISMTSGSTYIFGFAFRWANGTAGSAMFELFTSSGQSIFRMTPQSGGSVRCDGIGGAQLFLLSGGTVSTSWGYYEVKFAQGVSVEVRKNGTVVGSANNTFSNLIPAFVDFYGHGSAFPCFQWQDIVILDTAGSAPQNNYLGDVRIETIFPNGIGANAQWPSGKFTNLLSRNQASIETDTTGWQGLAGCTFARTTAIAKHGVASIEVTATGAGARIGTAEQIQHGALVSPSTQYTASANFRAASTTRSPVVEINWFTSAGAYITTTSGAANSETNTGWTMGFSTGNSPSTAAFASVSVAFGSTVSGEIHYIDEVQIAAGTNNTFEYQNNFTAVDEVPSDGDTTYVESDVVGQRDTYSHGDLATTQGTVFAVRPTLAFSRRATGARTVGAVARTTPGVTPSVGDTYSTGSSSATSVVLNTPTGTVAGDLLIVHVHLNGTKTVTPPTGWSSVRTLEGGSIFSRTATASEPASHTFTWTGLQYVRGAILRVAGPAIVDVSSSSTNSVNGLLTAAAATTTKNNVRLLAIYGYNDNGTFSTPTGYTEILDVGGTGTSNAISHIEQATPGSTGTPTTQHSGAAGSNGAIFLVAVYSQIADYDSVATVTPDDAIGVYKIKQVGFPTNPGTGAAWTIAEINAAEFGPKIVT